MLRIAQNGIRLRCATAGRLAKRGIDMRRVHVQSISVISIALTVILGCACVATFIQERVQFETLQQATETYISCESDARQLQSGSDYLTE